MTNTAQHQVKWVKRITIGLLLFSLFPSAGGSTILWSYSIDGITTLSVSESGRFIAVGCEDGFYYTFDTWGNLTGSGNVPAAVGSVDIADTGELLVGSAAGYTFCSKDGAHITTFLSYPVITVSASSDGALSLVCSQNNLYINQGTSMVSQLEVGSNSPFGVVSSDGRVACAAVDDYLHIFRNGGFQDQYNVGETVEHVFVSVDGRKIHFSTSEGTGYIDTEDGKLHIENTGSPIQNMAVSPSGGSVLMATESGLIWDGGYVNQLDSGGTDDIQCLAVTDSSLLVVGKGSTLHIMKNSTSVLTHDFGSSVTALDVSDTGDLLVVCTKTCIHVIQLFQETQSNAHVIPTGSRKSLPVTSPFVEVWSIPVDQNATFFVADMDGDGVPDIVLKEGTTIKFLDEYGVQKSVRDLEVPFSWGVPLDFDGDTNLDISIRFGNRFEFSVYDWREELLKDYYFDLFRNMTSQGSVIPFATLDSNNDGDRDILASVWTGYACSPRGVVSVDYASGDIEWFYQIGPGVWPNVVENIDGKGTTEIVIGSIAPCNCSDDEEFPDCETYVVALSGRGEELWKIHLGDGFRRAKVCAEDIHEDEGTEIIGFGYEASWTWGRLFVLNCHGDYLYDFEVDYSIFPGAVGDIDGDGQKEIVALDSRGYISVFTPDLQEKSKTLIGNSINQDSQVYVNDINGDGTCEILLVVEKGLFILDKDFTFLWEKEFEDDIKIALTRFSGCKNTLLILSDRLYAFSYKNIGEPCPLWEITERELTEEGTAYMETAESAYAAGEYWTSRPYYERALNIFSQLEDEEMIDFLTERITEVSTIIFKYTVRMGTILLALVDGGLCVAILYYWVTRKRWYRLAEGTLLLSLPVFLGLFQVYYASSQYIWAFATYFIPSLVFSVALFLRSRIVGFARTILALRSGHRDMLVLSIGRGEHSYRVAVESIEEKFRPVKESKEIACSEETREDLIKKVEYQMEILTRVSSGIDQTSLSRAEKVLQELGAEIYQRIIPGDFSDVLKAKFLLLEVEDTEIPWELMYTDSYFALKYAISRRIVTTESVTIRDYSGKRGKKALIISDPKEDLPGAQTECEIVCKRLSQKMETVFVEGGKANMARIGHHLGQGFDIIHYAGHVKDGLLLADGVMSPEDVREYIVGSPVVFVNGCKSEELARAFLLGGAMAYVGTIYQIHDRAAAEIAADFYDLCLQHRIGEALRRAREIHVTKGLVWASLIMYGDPTLKLL